MNNEIDQGTLEVCQKAAAAGMINHFVADKGMTSDEAVDAYTKFAQRQQRVIDAIPKVHEAIQAHLKQE